MSNSMYSPAKLVSVVSREDIQSKLKTLFVDLFFPRAITCETRDISLDTIDDPNIPMAAFCSPMVGSKVSRDDGYVSKTITPGYMKPKNSIDPNKLAVRPAGVSPEEFSSYDARNLKIVQATANQAVAIKARIEWLAIQAITTGKNIISGDGIDTYEIDWSINSKNIITQAGAGKWSTKDVATFDPNDDIETYAENSDGVTNIIIMGSDVWKTYRKFKRVSEILDTRRGSNSSLETALKDLGDSVSFKGYVGDTAIIVYSGKYTDENGTEQRFLDPNLMVFGNTNNQGLVGYGVIQDPELVRQGITKAEMAPKNYIVPGDPAIEYVQTHSAPQPIPARINRFVTVRVA
ncbi:Phage major capsid protein E [Serratia plymuthica]|uniref:Head protein n=1 Tax=Serratia plymuthica S13 TaxID=1348660 RepID=S4YNA3_SERPL|nr:major capsid protein [Serratia plymuthica]AGP46219.1 head protein [Serratia plymuthica S13]KYG15143.1 Phage major capsid protein E [Serratia plymuthica]QQT84255.1 major capsid protein [Serratia plymuthica]